MKANLKKLKYQIFLYMALGFALWFLFSTAISEWIYYLEDQRGIEFPFRFYIMLDIIQGVLLILINIPFLRFLIKHVDMPVQKIVTKATAHRNPVTLKSNLCAIPPHTPATTLSSLLL